MFRYFFFIFIIRMYINAKLIEYLVFSYDGRKNAV